MKDLNVSLISQKLAEQVINSTPRRSITFPLLLEAAIVLPEVSSCARGWPIVFAANVARDAAKKISGFFWLDKAA